MTPTVAKSFGWRHFEPRARPSIALAAQAGTFLQLFGTSVPWQPPFNTANIVGRWKSKLKGSNQAEHCVPKSKEVWKQMRYLSKALVVAIAIFAIGGIFSSVRANDMLIGSFTLNHPTQWNKTLLPAGTYKFKLVRTQTDANMLVVTGEKQSMDIYVFAQSACETCRNAGLTIEVQGDHRAITSLRLPGFHVDFSARGSLVDAKAQSEHVTPYSEQIDVRVNPN